MCQQERRQSSLFQYHGGLRCGLVPGNHISRDRNDLLSLKELFQGIHQAKGLTCQTVSENWQ